MAAKKLGHVGLSESAAIIALGLGLPIDEITETIKPVIADKETDGVAAGRVLGLHQIALVQAGDDVKVSLDLTMAVGAANPADRIDIEGDPPVHVTVVGGFHGDRSTVGTVVNAVPFIVSAPPGLHNVVHAPAVRPPAAAVTGRSSTSERSPERMRYARRRCTRSTRRSRSTRPSRRSSRSSRTRPTSPGSRRRGSPSASTARRRRSSARAAASSTASAGRSSRCAGSRASRGGGPTPSSRTSRRTGRTGPGSTRTASRGAGPRVVMEDHVDYELPFGILGRIVHRAARAPAARGDLRVPAPGDRRALRTGPGGGLDTRRLTIVHWFRRDLRVADNTALAHAARDADRVVPVFILDDHYADRPARRPRALSIPAREPRGARAGASPGGRPAHRAAGARRRAPCPRCSRRRAPTPSTPTPRSGPTRSGATARRRPRSRPAGAKFRLFDDELLVAPDGIATDAGDPYTVFTPFSKKWMAAEKREPWPVPAALDTPELPGVPLSKVARLARPAVPTRRRRRAARRRPSILLAASSTDAAPRATPTTATGPTARGRRASRRTCTSARSRRARSAPRPRRPGGPRRRRRARARPQVRPRARLARVLPPRALPLSARRDRRASVRSSTASPGRTNARAVRRLEARADRLPVRGRRHAASSRRRTGCTTARAWSPPRS